MTTKNIVSALLLITGLLLIAGCKTPAQLPYSTNVSFEKYSIGWAVKSVDDIDTKYGNNWRAEELNANMVAFDNIKPIADATYELRLEMQRSGINDSPALDFLGARVRMLEAQRDFQLAKKLDSRDLAEMKKIETSNGTKTVINASLDQFSCDKEDDVRAATQYYNTTYALALDAVNLLDKTLQQLENKGMTAETDYIGTNVNRPRFYFSPLGRIALTVNVNRILVDKYCAEKKLKAQNATQITTPVLNAAALPNSTG